MIYLLSDLHGNLDFPGINEYISKYSDDDLLIILGDIGLSFDDAEENKRFTDKFLNIDKNIAIIDGNHENFQYLNSFPTEEWNGGIIGRLTDKIVHLKRGNIYNIDNKSFFVFGGCKSSPKWKEMGLWHYGEEPEDEEIELAHRNFEKHNFTVDYILTHKYEQTPVRGTVSEKLLKLTEYIEANVTYKKWYAGHWHSNDKLDDKHTFIYNKLKEID